MLKKPDLEVFSERLTQIRRAKGYDSVQDACNALGMPKTTYGKYESGYRFPRLDALFEIANFYGVCPIWLVGGTDNPQNPKLSDSKPTISRQNHPSVDASLDGLKAKVIGEDGNILELSLRVLQTK